MLRLATPGYMSIRSNVRADIERIAVQQRKLLMPLTDRLPLLESGLHWLCASVRASGTNY
jgi:hypothetical protein